MTAFINVLRMLIRVTFLVMLLLGLYIWVTGNAAVVPAHMGLGFLFVLMLWALGAVAIRAATGPALLLIVWGAVIPAVGIWQRTVMLGNLHWIVRVGHLLVAMIAMPIAERVAKRMLESPAGARGRTA